MSIVSAQKKIVLVDAYLDLLLSTGPAPHFFVGAGCFTESLIIFGLPDLFLSFHGMAVCFPLEIFRRPDYNLNRLVPSMGV